MGPKNSFALWLAATLLLLACTISGCNAPGNPGSPGSSGNPGIPAVSAGTGVPAAASPVVDVTQSGGVPDGRTLSTAAIQKAIEALSQAGGGILHFPAGRYLTGTLQLKSNVKLQLDEGATILGSTDAADYRNLDPFTSGDNIPLGHALIVALDASNVGIMGPGGIDGQGRALRDRQNPYRVRPFLVRFIRCVNVTVKDVHLTNPGAWTLNFFLTRNAAIENVVIRTRNTGLANNDGINIDSCESFRIRNCDVDSGDDALVIKSTTLGKPCRDIVATDCRLSTRTNAIKLGTESIAGFADVSISHCQVSNVGMAGIALYNVDGGDLSRVTISDITMDRLPVAIAVRLGSRLKTFRAGEKPQSAPGRLRDVTIRNVTATHIRNLGILVSGVPNHAVENLTLDHITLELPGGGTADQAQTVLPEKETAYPEYNMFGTNFPAYALYARHVSSLTLTHITSSLTQPDGRPAAKFIDVQTLTAPDFTPPQPTARPITDPPEHR